MPYLYSALHRRFGPRDGLTRREMLELTLASAAGLLVSDRFVFGQARPSGKRVVIVGAGFSGLAAGHELAGAGYDVTIVEARNRVGGRVISFADLVPGKHVEGGGELIGSNHPTWVSYRERFKLQFLDVTEEETFDFPIVLGGKALTADESEALYEELVSTVNRMNDDAARVADPYEPWKAPTPNAEALDRRTLASWIAALDASPRCKTALDVMMMSDNGVRTAWQSYLGNLAMVKGGGLERFWTDSEVYRCRGGNQQLARKLADAIGTTRVMLRTPVSAIATSDTGARVTLANGKTIEADDVIVAISPRVWNRIAFDPPLPGQLAPQMGSNVKFLMALKGPFWRQEELAPDLLSDGAINQTWHATDGQRGAGDVMTAFSGGPSADRCREWSPAQRVGNYLAELGKVYKGLSASYVKARFMDWPGDVWTGGSYTFPAPGQVTTMGPILRQGIGHLHFAGEHTCYAFVGYMEGALNSGAALAKKLAARDGVIREDAA